MFLCMNVEKREAQMKTDLNEILRQNRIMIIDGSMSTALEALGADLNNTL